MTNKRSTWEATFVSQEIIKWGDLHRRIHFKNLKNNAGLTVKDSFFIDESESLKIIGRLNYGDKVSFYADDDLSNIKFCYPHGEKNNGKYE